MPADFFDLDPSQLRLRPRPEGHEPIDHFVEFYEKPEGLVGSVATFISKGITEGDGGLVIATPAVSRALEVELAHRIDLDEARRRGLFVAFDAAEVLARFLREDGAPDPVKFDEAMRDAARLVAGDGRNVRVFGEMVGVLWGRGEVAAALSLEDLWNEFVAKYRLRLFCAYPTSAFGATTSADIAAICDRHTHVLIPRAEAR